MKLTVLTFLNNFKKFLTIFNSSFEYNFIFSHNFNFKATCNANLVVPECILTFYTEVITVLAKLKNVFFDNLITKSFGKLLR